MKAPLTPRTGRIAIAVAVTALAAFVFRSELLTLLIEPIGWLLWAGWRLAASVDQAVCWTVVVLISAALVIRLLPTRLGAVREPPSPQESRWGRAGRLEHWEDLAHRATQSQEGRTAFQAGLTALADAVALSTKRSRRQPRQVTPTSWRRVPVLRLLAGRRRLSELRALEDQLSSMESALEINHEDSAD